jgi:uncharacterized protein
MTTIAALRESYPAVSERARKKTLDRIDAHMRNFIARSPFLCLGTASAEGADVSPRGDRPGFVQVLDDVTLAIPDWPGNNRLDSFANIVANPQVGLLFLIPGVEEALRVNGSARVTQDAAMLARWGADGKRPRAVLVVEVREAFLHCGKAVLRSRLWKEDFKISREELPSYGRMLKDQIEIEASAEDMQASVEEGYKNGLY